jgi:hypothetical protein
MEQRTLRDRSIYSQQVKKSHVLWNPKICYRVQTSLHFVHILSQSIHSTPSHPILLTSSEIKYTHLRVDLPRCLFNWCHHQNPVCFFFLLIRVTFLPFSCFLLPPDRHLVKSTNKEAPHSTVSFLGPNIFPSSLFSRHPQPSPSLYVREQFNLLKPTRYVTYHQC